MAKNTGLEERITQKVLSSNGSSFAKRKEEIKNEDINQVIQIYEEAGFNKSSLLNPSQTEYKKLLAAIPEGHKYSSMKKIAGLLVGNERIENYYIAQVIYSSVSNQRRTSKNKLAKRDYAKERYFQEIKNRCKALKRRWKPLGYTITHSLRNDFSKLTRTR